MSTDLGKKRRKLQQKKRYISTTNQMCRGKRIEFLCLLLPATALVVVSGIAKMDISTSRLISSRIQVKQSLACTFWFSSFFGYFLGWLVFGCCYSWLPYSFLGVYVWICTISNAVITLPVDFRIFSGRPLDNLSIKDRIRRYVIQVKRRTTKNHVRQLNHHPIQITPIWWYGRSNRLELVELRFKA